MSASFKENVFNDELLTGEKIVWQGQPDPSILFSRIDIFLIPFSLLWGGFALFWEISVIYYGAPLSFTLFGIPFVLIGLYMIFGRFIMKKYLKQRTYYAITNQRVLVLSNFIGRSMQAQFINHIPVMNKSVRKNGYGTIIFGNPSFLTSMYGNTGLEFFNSPFGNSVVTFYDIPNVNEVYQVINDVRRRTDLQ